MRISKKLVMLACSSVALMLVIGGAGLYVSNSLDDALENVNTRGTLV